MYGTLVIKLLTGLGNGNTSMDSYNFQLCIWIFNRLNSFGCSVVQL
jgi:hypothetical protein